MALPDATMRRRVNRTLLLSAGQYARHSGHSSYSLTPFEPSTPPFPCCRNDRLRNINSGLLCSGKTRQIAPKRVSGYSSILRSRVRRSGNTVIFSSGTTARVCLGASQTRPSAKEPGLQSSSYVVLLVRSGVFRCVGVDDGVALVPKETQRTLNHDFGSLSYLWVESPQLVLRGRPR